MLRLDSQPAKWRPCDEVESDHCLDIVNLGVPWAHWLDSLCLVFCRKVKVADVKWFILVKWWGDRRPLRCIDTALCLIGRLAVAHLDGSRALSLSDLGG